MREEREKGGMKERERDGGGKERVKEKNINFESQNVKYSSKCPNEGAKLNISS